MNISPETERLQNALAELASAIIKIIHDRVDQTLSGTVPARLPALNGLAEPIADDQMVEKAEIAKMLGITIRTVDNWMDRGLLPYFKIGRSVRFRKNDVVQHLNQCTRVCRR